MITNNNFTLTIKDEDDIETLFDQLPDLILPEKYIYRDNQQIIVGYFSSFVSYCTRKNLAKRSTNTDLLALPMITVVTYCLFLIKTETH